MSAHLALPVVFSLLPPGEGGAKRRMRVRSGANVTLARNPYPHPSAARSALRAASPDGRGVHIEPSAQP